MARTKEAIERSYVGGLLRKLLEAEGSCIHALDGRSGAPLDENGPQHPVIRGLIVNAKPAWQKSLASYATTKYLDRFDAERRNVMGGIDVLDYALDIGLAFPLKRNVAERLVNRVAAAGWYGRLEAIAMKLRGRGPTAEEVVLLIDAYVNNKGVKSGTETLEQYIDHCLSREEAARQRARIAKHDQDFDDDVF